MRVRGRVKEDPMSHRLMPSFFMIAVLSVAACAGGATTGTGGASTPVPAGSAPGASTDAGAGAAPCAPSSNPGTVQASMAGIAFTPTTIDAKVGDVVAWTNNDSTAHTATVDDDPDCTTETLAPGATGGISFSAAGSYAFHCKIHSNMTGTIEVTP
jgi:plastocyanin